MSTLNDYLKNLPQKPVEAKQSQQKDSTFTIAKKGYAFKPEIGKCYEVNFGEVPVDGKMLSASARIKVNGLTSNEWIDLDTNEPLVRRFAQMVVQAYREISCTDNNAANSGA